MPPQPDAAPPPLPPELAPLLPTDPVTIGPFRVIGRLGSGGMGAVYGALDAEHRCVAVKVIHAEHARRPEYRELFAREAELVSRIDAECTPRFLGADPNAPEPWLATEFVPGRTLQQHVREFGPLDEAALRAFAAGTAEALAAIHAAGVVHLEVKPGNIMLAPDGPKVLDFGIARAIGGTTDKNVYGTPGWAAPERLDRQPGTPAADMFAWGGLIVFAATGRSPFGTGTSAELLERVRAGDCDLTGVPEELMELVARALSTDPEARPTAVEAFHTVLALDTVAADAIEEPGEDAAAIHRKRLRALLHRVWTGFDAAGHRPELWMALGTAAGGVGVAAGGAAALATQGTAGGGAAAGSGKLVGTASAAGGGASWGAGAGTLTKSATVTAAGTGLSGKAMLTVAAGATAAAVAGGWLVGRAVTDQPLLPFTDPEPSATAALAPSPEEDEKEGQEVRFRNLTLWFPEDWTVHVIEDIEFVGFGPDHEGREIVDDWIAAHPPGNPGCAEVDWTHWEWPAALVECPHIRILGPGGITYGGAVYEPITEEPDAGLFAPSQNPLPCIPGIDAYEADPASFPGQSPLVEELAPVGDRSALYREYLTPCANPDGRDPELLYYTQRSWFLPESQILIVDEYGIEDIDAILADGEFASRSEED